MAMTTTTGRDIVVGATQSHFEDEIASERRRGSDDSNDAAARRGMSLGGGLAWMFAFLGFIIGSQVISDNSFFTHLANGRVVLDGGGIPRVDPYSFSATGMKVTVQSWLATIVYAWLEDTFGGFSIRLFNGGLAALISAGTWKLTEKVEPLLVRLAIVGAMTGVGAFMWGPRPSLFGLLGLVALLLVQQRSLPLWSLIPIMWIWVNTHGSFPLGLVAIAAIGIGRAIDHRELPRHEIRVFGWGVAGVLSGAIGPLGLEILWFPIHLMSRRQALDGVGEWSSPAFDEPLGLLLVVFVGLHLVAAARGARWASLLPGGIFLFASLLAARNLAQAIPIFAVTLAPHLSATFGSLRASLRGLLPRGVALASAAGIALVAVAVVGQNPVSLQAYPVNQVTWMEARSLVANPAVHLVHRDTVGNYLELRYGTAASVFVDDRFDFYPLDVLDDHRSLFFGGDYREVLDRYDADVVLWEASTGLSQWLEEAPEWNVVLSDDDWMIACRRGTPAADRCAARAT